MTRLIYASVYDEKNASTVITYDASDAENETVYHTIDIAISAHQTIHGDSQQELSVHCRFMDTEPAEPLYIITQILRGSEQRSETFPEEYTRQVAEAIYMSGTRLGVKYRIDPA